jgi:hypothetical protein
MKWLELVKTLAPVILTAVNPALGAISPLIVHGITTAESMPGASGTDKLNSVVDLVNTGVQGMNTAAGKTVVDPNLVNSALVQGINTTIATVNLIHNTPVKTQ